MPGIRGASLTAGGGALAATKLEGAGRLLGSASYLWLQRRGTT